jgi:hypothetical protein
MNSVPVNGGRCSVGRIPNAPQNAAGLWIDPRVSPPMSNGVGPAATATAGPVDEPPVPDRHSRDSSMSAYDPIT